MKKQQRHKHYLYKRWYIMAYNYTNPNSPAYKEWHAQGIEVYEEWLGLGGSGFDNYKDWVETHLGPMPGHNYVVRRIDSQGSFVPGNLTWSTWRELGNHRHNNRMIELHGRSQSLADWCRELGCDYVLAKSRLHQGWTVKEALYGRNKKSTAKNLAQKA